MTDLEMTKLCAEAIGASMKPTYRNHKFVYGYHPLVSDTQAMALVKRFEISIAWSWPGQVGCMAKEEARHDEDKRHDNISCDYKDLNRAIVECCALMWHRQKELGFTSG